MKFETSTVVKKENIIYEMEGEGSLEK